MFHKERWYEAHRSHAYQWAARKWGHLRVIIAISVINIFWLLPLAYVVKWSTNSGHRVKAVQCHNEVNDESRKENETEVHGRLQA